MSYTSGSTHTINTFTFDGTNLLYGSSPRTPVKELRYLLARGSGYVVRGRRMPKPWFQAQCAHYGLPTNGTLAALRNRLDVFLARPLPQVPKGLIMLEEQKRAEHALVTTRISVQEKTLPNETKHENDQMKERTLSKTSDDGSNLKIPRVQHPVPKQAIQPLVDKTNLPVCSTPVAQQPKKPTLPRAKLVAVAKFRKSVRWDPDLAESALQEIKLRMGRPEPTSGTDTESDVDDDSFRSSNLGTFAPRHSCQSVARWPLHAPYDPVSFVANVVSGLWNLRVTCHTMSPLPAPWRTASSKWLRGHMNVELSGDGRSLTGDFALLGLDGRFKSRKCDLRADGISAWVRFIAQMPIATSKPLRNQGHKEHNVVFGPSESQYGYLRFYGGNRVGGMLRCRKYGKLEFTGIRVGGPVDTTSEWANFIE